MSNSYSLYELNVYIKRVIALNFNEPIWVNAEISQIKEVRGNIYIDLVHLDDETQEVTAQMSANIWVKNHLFLKSKFKDILSSLLQTGVQIKIKARVEFSERYGIKLNIEDIDPAFSMGMVELQRQKMISRLVDEGFIGMNRQINLPTIIQKIAVISSSTAAGFIDFHRHLTNNGYGYKYQITLIETSMQGQNTEREVLLAFDQIHKEAHRFDAILIIRGGGSKLDLSAFDSFNIGVKISKSTLPVITGIGHEIDTTVADLCAHTSVKTPTALANLLIDRSLNFESIILEMSEKITIMAKQNLVTQQALLGQSLQLLELIPKEKVKSNSTNIMNSYNNIFQLAQVWLKRHEDFLKNVDQSIVSLHPKNIQKKGFAIIEQNGKIVSRGEQLDVDQSVAIQFYDQTVIKQ